MYWVLWIGWGGVALTVAPTHSFLVCCCDLLFSATEAQVKRVLVCGKDKCRWNGRCTYFTLVSDAFSAVQKKLRRMVDRL